MDTGSIHCRLYGPLGMVLVIALQKARNVPLCPQLKLSPALPNQVFYSISRYFLSVPKSWFYLWLFFFLPPLHHCRIICQSMQISLQQTFFLFPASNGWCSWQVQRSRSIASTGDLWGAILTSEAHLDWLMSLLQLHFSLTSLSAQS